MKKDVLGNLAKFTEKHSFSSGLRSATLLKKRLWYWCFPVNFAKFLRTPFLENTASGCFYQSVFTDEFHLSRLQKFHFNRRRT